MDSAELARRLVEIARGGSATITTERACWVDGEECPYGKPEGQFSKRPAVWCRLREEKDNGGCKKLNDYLYEFEEAGLDFTEAGLARALRKLAKNSAENSQEKAVLELAASLAEEAAKTA